MALMDDIRRRVREKHLKEKELKREQEEQKKELERQRQEERKKEQERGQKKNQKDFERRQQEKQKNEQASQQPTKPASSGKDEYVRVKGRYGWTWTKRGDIDADTQQQGVLNDRPSSRRALDGVLRSSLKKEENRDTFDGPVSYVSTAGAASPISDVSYSQSPAKKSVSIMEPEDHIATARRRLMEKEALNEVAEKGEDPTAVARRALMEKEHREAARNVEDPIALARRLLLEKERKEATRKEADTSSLAALPQSPRQPVNGVKSVHEDPVQASRRLAREREEARARQEKEEARAKEARNPVTLMERRNEARRSFLSPVAGDSHATPPKVVDAILWDDSENEEPSEEEDKKKLRATRKRSSESRKDPNEEDGGEDKKKKPTRKKNSDGRKSAKHRSSHGSVSGRYSDESDDEFDEDFENTLIPTFENPQFGPFPLEPLKLPSGDNADDVHEVPASINRYLKPYQQKGITFLYSCIVVLGTGAILGDVSIRRDTSSLRRFTCHSCIKTRFLALQDMGLGKTVQIIALLASLLEKTGTGKDAIELNRRRRLIAAKRRELNVARDEALLFNGVNVALTGKVEVEGLALPERAPILIIVPPSVVANWMKEFKTWGYFGVGSYHVERQEALNSVKDGTNEVLVCGASLFLGDFDEIASVKWKLIVVDEFHGFKVCRPMTHVCNDILILG
jgi:SNF2 family DNA or RNA helicase